jgi:hypothetical protein
VAAFDTGGSANFNAKLWDGTTVIDSTQVVSTGASFTVQICLSGVLTSPAANIRISVSDASRNTGSIKFNASGNTKDSFIYGVRIQ